MLSLTNVLTSISSSASEQLYSLTLDGAGDYLDVGVIDLDDGDVAFSCWVFLKEWTNYDCVISNRDQSSTRVGYQIRTNGTANQIELVSDFGGTALETIATGIELYKWTHVFCDIVRAGNQVVYINGVQNALTDISGQSAVDMTTTTGFRVGRDSDGTNYSNMLVDEVAIFNAVLGSDRAKGIYNDGKPFDLNGSSPDGGYTHSVNLVAYWRMFNGPFDDKANGIVHDAHNPGYGAELITDGTFDATLSTNWTEVDSGCAEHWNSKALKIIDVGGTHNRVRQDIDLDTYVGKTLKLEYDVLSSSGLGADAFKAYLAGDYVTIPQTDGHQIVYWAQSSAGLTNFYFNLYNQDNDDYIIIDNVSVKVLNGYPGIAAADATFSTNTPDDQTMSNVLTLDGAGDYLSTEADSTAAARTYSFWARSASTADNKGVFGHGSILKGAFHFNASDGGDNTSNPLLYTGSGQAIYWPNVSAQDDGNWHHWAIYLDPGTGGSQLANSKVWVDGVAQTPINTPGSGTATAYSTGLTIGSDGANEFLGDIDQFAIFDTELPTDAVASLAGQMWDGTDGDDANWTIYGSNTKAEDTGAVKITEAGGTNSDRGAYINLTDDQDLNADLIPGRTYKLTCEVKVSGGSLQVSVNNDTIQANSSAITSTDFVTASIYFTEPVGATTTHLRIEGLDSTESVWIKSISLIDTNARQKDLTKTIGNYDSDWTDNLINYWKMGDGNHDEPQEGIIHDQADSGYGAELVTNRDYATASDWNKKSNWPIDTTGGATAVADGSANTDINQIITSHPVANNVYKVTFDVVSVTAGSVYFTFGGATGADRNSVGTYSEYITASNTDRLKIDSHVSNLFAGSVDNVSVKKLNGYPGITAADATFIKQPV